MRHGSSNRRQRNRNNNRRGNQQRTQVFDSNGPDVRIRGTAHQVAEKYLALAKDANSAGDRIMAENYYQHAEHYIRIITENNGKFSAEKEIGNKNQSQSQDKPNKTEETEKNTQKEDDLALPKSILGPEVVVKSEIKNSEEEVVD